jgi:hypothetical protein
MFNWTISELTRRASDGFIQTAHWRCTSGEASVYGSCGWADGSPVIPYPEVTQEQVLEWVWANGVNKSEVESNLEKQVDALNNPVSINGVPW